MDLNALFELQFVMFAEMIAGYLLCRFKVIKPSDRSVLSKLVVNLLLPCSIIASFQMEMNSEILKNFIGIFVISVLIQILCSLIASFAYNRYEHDRKAVLQFSTVCSNAGFLGNAVAQGVYGDLGLLYGQIYLIPLRIVMWSAGVAYFEKKQDGGKGSVMKSILTHPCIIALEIGLVIMIFQIPVPKAVGTLLSGLGKCSTPLIMLFLGMVMAQVGFKGLFTKDTWCFALIRLFLIPAAVLGMCMILHAEPIVIGLSVLLAAMPAGSTTAVLAQQYHADEEFAANVVVMTTLLSIALLPVWVLVLNAIL
jgi:predicted permease